MRLLSSEEVLSRLAKGPFLLTEEGVLPSPFYEVVETPLGTAVFPATQAARRLGFKWRSVGERAYLRRLFTRALEAYALSRKLPFAAKGSACLIGPPERVVLVALSLTSREEFSSLEAAEVKVRVVVSPRRRKKGVWVPLAPGCLEDVAKILDAHFSGQAQD